MVPIRILSFSHRVPVAGADLELGVQIVAKASKLLRRLKVLLREPDPAAIWLPGGVGDGWGVSEAREGFVTSFSTPLGGDSCVQ